MVTLDDVKNAKRREDLVPGYAAWIRQYSTGGGWPDVSAINHAIQERWSWYALAYIKRLAWNSVFRPKRRAEATEGPVDRGSRSGRTRPDAAP